MLTIAKIFTAAVLLPTLSMPAQQAPLPDISTLMQQVEEHQRKLDQVRENYTYREITETNELDKNGNVKKSETEEDDVFYVNTHEIDRLVKKNGRDLTDNEQKKEQERVTKAIDKAQKTPAGESTEKDAVSISHLLSIMTVSRPRREMVDSRSTIAFDFTGDPHAKTHGMAEDASKKLSGTLWIDEQDREVRRMIAHFDDNFHLGFGLFSVGKGSSFTFDQKLVNNELWLPTDAQAHVVAHAIGIIGYRADIRVVDKDYQRFHAEAQQQPDAHPRQ